MIGSNNCYIVFFAKHPEFFRQVAVTHQDIGLIQRAERERAALPHFGGIHQKNALAGTGDQEAFQRVLFGIINQ